MTLVGKRLTEGTTLAQFAEQTRALRDSGRVQGLRSQVQRASLWPSGQRIQIDAQLVPVEGQRTQVMRQYLYVNPPFGYVAARRPAEQAAARRDLDDTAQNLVPLPPRPRPLHLRRSPDDTPLPQLAPQKLGSDIPGHQKQVGDPFTHPAGHKNRFPPVYPFNRASEPVLAFVYPHSTGHQEPVLASFTPFNRA